MPDKEFDPWSFSSGLVDSYTGTVEDAYFGFDPQYMDGKRCVLKLEIQAEDPDVGDAGKVIELYPCGDGWEPANKGAKLVREDGNMKPLNNQSGVALLVTSGVEAGAGEELKKRGTPFDANIWKGLRAEWERKSFEFKSKDGQQTYSRMLMAKYLGTGGSGGAAAPAAQAAPAPVKAEPDAAGTTPAAAATNGDLDAKTKAKLKVLAKQIKGAGGNHDSFVERAFTEVDGVMDNKAAEDAVMDPSDAGIFATA
jgi:hypothetical protein